MERAFEMACAHTGEFGEPVQRNGLPEVLFDVIQDNIETSRWQSTSRL
jgi:hypothetical protein